MKHKKKDDVEVVSKDDRYEISPFREMESYWDDFFRHPFSLVRSPVWPRFPAAEKGMVAPVVDIFEDGDDMVIKAEIPGIAKEDLHVEISENSVTISGEKKQEHKVDRKNYHRVECSYGSFSRSFRLPDNVIVDQAKASFNDGVLEVRIAKSDTSKKKTITID